MVLKGEFKLNNQKLLKSTELCIKSKCDFLVFKRCWSKNGCKNSYVKVRTGNK